MLRLCCVLNCGWEFPQSKACFVFLEDPHPQPDPKWFVTFATASPHGGMSMCTHTIACQPACARASVHPVVRPNAGFAFVCTPAKHPVTGGARVFHTLRCVCVCVCLPGRWRVCISGRFRARCVPPHRRLPAPFPGCLSLPETAPHPSPPSPPTSRARSWRPPTFRCAPSPRVVVAPQQRASGKCPPRPAAWWSRGAGVCHPRGCRCALRARPGRHETRGQR